MYSAVLGSPVKTPFIFVIRLLQVLPTKSRLMCSRSVKPSVRSQPGFKVRFGLSRNRCSLGWALGMSVCQQAAQVILESEGTEKTVRFKTSVSCTVGQDPCPFRHPQRRFLTGVIVGFNNSQTLHHHQPPCRKTTTNPSQKKRASGIQSTILRPRITCSHKPSSRPNLDGPRQGTR